MKIPRLVILAVVGVFQGLVSGGTVVSSAIMVLSMLALLFYGLG